MTDAAETQVTQASEWKPTEAELLAMELEAHISFKVYTSDDDCIRNAAAMLRRLATQPTASDERATGGAEPSEQRAMEVPERLIGELRRLYRGLEMSAGIIRDPKRTGGWDGADNTANAFARYAATAQSIYAVLKASTALTAAPVAGLVGVPRDALPANIGRLHLGDKWSNGERLCSHGHDVAVGHPLYWPERLGEYPDDVDPLCLAHAVEQAESDSGWCECAVAAALDHDGDLLTAAPVAEQPATGAVSGGEVERLVRLTGDESDPYSFYSDGDDDGRVITQHRYYRWGDSCVVAIGELNSPNGWDDDAFDAKCAALEAALPSTSTTEAGS